MQVGWLRGLALVAAVLLGGIAGVGAAVVVDDGAPPDRTADPLGLGVDLVNQSCDGGTLLAVGRGSTRPGLRAAVVDNPGAHYLDTAASCPTLYAPLDLGVPEYVVYLGPFDTPGAACELRMTVEHKGDYVTSLRAGNQTYVKCPCELPVSTFPVLTPDMGAPDALEGMWIRQLQGMLVDTGRLVEDVQESGQYDATTVAVVKRIQTVESLTPTGIVDAATWAIIRDRACRGYDY
jgi:hypothetical protein